MIGSKSSAFAPHTGHSAGGFGVDSSVSHPQTVQRHRGIFIYNSKYGSSNFIHLGWIKNISPIEKSRFFDHTY